MIPLYIPPEEFAAAAQSQRDYLRALANRLDQGEQLSESLDRMIVAAVLRGFASGIPDHEPRKRGQRPVIPAGDAAILFATYVRSGRTKSTAVAQIAELYGVSVEATRRVLKKHSAEAGQIVCMMVGPVKTEPKKIKGS